MTPTATCAMHGALEPRFEPGQSIVEFAICLPLLLVMSLGVVETAYALMTST